MTKAHKQPRQSFTFQVELTVEAESEQEALSVLNECLKSPGVQQYRILRELSDADRTQPSDAPSAPNSPEMRSIDKLIRRVMNDQALVRLHVVKGRGVKLSLPCRVLHFDEEKDQISVYHVDEKAVYTFGLNEIDDFQALY